MNKHAARWMLVCALVLAGLARAAAGDGQTSPASAYWPHEPGTLWRYENSEGHGWSLQVLPTERLRDEDVMVTERVDEGETHTARTYYAIRAGAVVAVSDFFYGPALQRLPAPQVVWPAAI